MENRRIPSKPSNTNGQNSAQNNLDDLSVRFEQLVKRKKAQLRVVEPLVAIPSWATTMRGTPNVCLRSALFADIQGKERIAYKKRTLLASVDGIEVRFLGVQLIQSDLDV